MNSAEASDIGSTRDARRARRLGTVVPVCVIVVGLCAVALLQRRLDALRPPVSAEAEIEELYVSGEAARRASLAFNGLVADWYWMRALQYTGRKMLNYEGRINLDDLSPLGMKMLAPLLDRATTLDPQYMAAYEFAAVVLPSIDRAASVRLLEKGIKENPGVWRLYQHLGYVRWQAGEFAAARAAYEEGARQSGAPGWMGVLAARMEAEGGSRRTAREMYLRMYAETDDAQIKKMARGRLLWLQSLDERDALRRIIADHTRAGGRCPAGFSEMTRQMIGAGFKLDSDGAPLDPAGTPYRFVAASCDVDLTPNSEVPYK